MKQFCNNVVVSHSHHLYTIQSLDAQIINMYSIV
jgi:hypothetical protein